MRFAPTSATTLALALLLAACGDGTEDTAQPADATTTEILPGDAAPAAGESPAPGETPAPDATPTDAATATPSPSPTPTPAPTATAAPPVAAATAPAMFAVCAACHSVARGEHGIGPSLAGVFGDRAGTQPGFEYSQAMKDSGLVWNQANLDRYLTDPRGVVPGTTMAYAGLKNAAQRQAVIDYMRGL
jgi:cytochrome c